MKSNAQQPNSKISAQHLGQMFGQVAANPPIAI